MKLIILALIICLCGCSEDSHTVERTDYTNPLNQVDISLNRDPINGEMDEIYLIIDNPTIISLYVTVDINRPYNDFITFSLQPYSRTEVHITDVPWWDYSYVNATVSVEDSINPNDPEPVWWSYDGLAPTEALKSSG